MARHRGLPTEKPRLTTSEILDAIRAEVIREAEQELPPDEYKKFLAMWADEVIEANRYAGIR